MWRKTLGVALEKLIPIYLRRRYETRMRLLLVPKRLIAIYYERSHRKHIVIQ